MKLGVAFRPASFVLGGDFGVVSDVSFEGDFTEFSVPNVVFDYEGVDEGEPMLEDVGDDGEDEARGDHEEFGGEEKKEYDDNEEWEEYIYGADADDDEEEDEGEEDGEETDDDDEDDDEELIISFSDGGEFIGVYGDDNDDDNWDEGAAERADEYGSDYEGEKKADDMDGEAEESTQEEGYIVDELDKYYRHVHEAIGGAVTAAEEKETDDDYGDEGVVEYGDDYGDDEDQGCQESDENARALVVDISNDEYDDTVLEVEVVIGDPVCYPQRDIPETQVGDEYDDLMLYIIEHMESLMILDEDIEMQDATDDGDTYMAQAPPLGLEHMVVDQPWPVLLF
ncbi:hypothetical protein BJV82DRAFT_674227 [Fennellomyces sp. T-0311]|nr:hypothetical protein BJV82DRAFT_674227 [Fennellomyces sp. T-0311]